ncbi:unnamed protein product [Didymodactylos carnosus]|uniref:Integrase catalytic domain-containing protein n=1 Tax=Didymodactylos carnosus TaxID=1234261 RepID=A0A8S2DZM5_9BILA|nr:unnamed protein product [Didymodactylos carnosus]CAF3837484.1 unnamed protein product [Didymodactylos carnosus]
MSCPDGPFKFILNYQDHFTKFCVLRPMKTKTAAEVAYHLLDIFIMFGAPATLQSDNGREFVAKVIEELAEMWKGLKIVHGRARHPQSQGSVERCNQDTKQRDMSSLNNRIQRTNEIHQDAREGQKRQADQFLQNTVKTQKLANLNVGDNVLVSVPDLDRGPTDARNILAVIMEIKHDKYKLGTELTTFSSSLANFSKQILKRNLIGF